MFRFPPPSISWKWVGRSGKQKKKKKKERKTKSLAETEDLVTTWCLVGLTESAKAADGGTRCILGRSTYRAQTYNQFVGESDGK